MEKGSESEAPTRTVAAKETVPGERTFHRGESVGRYVVLEPLGRGGMGVVLAAYDPELDRKVAIKLLHAGAPGSEGREARLRLQREARAMAKLSHPHVVTVHDVGLFEGEVFVAMEFVRGQTLGAWRAQHADADWREVVGVFLQAGEGLRAAHRKGLVHRDFKPDNVLMSRDGVVKVTDFGLARAARRLGEEGRDGSRSGESRSGESRHPSSLAWAVSDEIPSQLRGGRDLLETPVTVDGVVVGTPAYLPPEAYGDGDLDARSDQFAFCVTLWDALFGEKPFRGKTYPAILAAMGQGRIEDPPPDHGVPPSVVDAVRRGLQPLPEDRWASMDELLAALRRELAPAEASRSRWRTFAWLSLPAAVVLGGLLWWNHRANLCTGVDAPLEAVWNDERRAALVAAASRVEGPDADALGARLARVVDDWARRWSDARTDSCRATRVRGEQSDQLLDLRVACFDHKLQEMDFVLEILESSGPEALTDAATKLRRAAPLPRCSDAEALLAPIRPPESDEIRRRVAALREQLADAEATLLAGQPQEAVRKAREAEAAAVELDYPPLQAEASGLAARTLRNVSDFHGARETAHRALSAALAGRHEYQLARSLIDLVDIVGGDLEDFEQAEYWFDHAQGALHRVGESRNQLEAKLMNAWGGVLYRQGRFQSSLEAFQRAYELGVEVSGAEAPDTFAAANNLVVLLYSTGRIQEAHDRLEQLAVEMESALGEHHPHLLSVLTNLSGTSAALARLDDCVTYARRAASRFEDVYDRGAPPALPALSNLGVCLERLGRYDEALAVHDRALAISRSAYGDENSQTLIEMSNRALALSALGRTGEALDQIRRSLAQGETVSRRLGSPSAEWISAHGTLSSILREAGRAEEAIEAAKRAVELLEEAGRIEEISAAPFFNHLGESYLMAGRLDEAIRAFDSARALAAPAADGEPSEDPKSLAEARLGLARARAAAGFDPAQWRGLTREAARFYEGRVGVAAETAREQIETLLSSPGN